MCLKVIKLAPEHALFSIVITYDHVSSAVKKLPPIILTQGKFWLKASAIDTCDKLESLYGRPPQVEEFRSLLRECISRSTPEVALAIIAGVSTGLNGDPYLILKMTGTKCTVCVLFSFGEFEFRFIGQSFSIIGFIVIVGCVVQHC